MNWRWAACIIGLSAAAPSAALGTLGAAVDDRPTLSIGSRLPDGLAESVHPIGAGRMVFTHDGRLVLTDARDHILDLVETDAPLVTLLVESGTDLTGDGVPDLHVATSDLGWSLDRYVINGRRPDRLHHIRDGQPEPTRFRARGAGPPVLPIGVAYQFAGHTPCNRLGWETRVDVQWNGTGFRRLSTFSPASGGTELSSAQDRAIADALVRLIPRESESAATWGHADPVCMLAEATIHDLYAGHGVRAAARINAVWPQGLPSRDRFRCAMVRALQAAGELEWLEQAYRRPVPQELGVVDGCRADGDTLWLR